MPRLSPSFLLQARSQNKLLPILLRECRDLDSARNELRWLTEHAFKRHGLPVRPAAPHKALRRVELSPRSQIGRTLEQYVRRRGRSEPLQYILGTQPFGQLEILCRKSVLIPRPDTETYTRLLASLVKRASLHASREGRPFDKLRILDLCTGSGCIPLLLYSLLKGNLYSNYSPDSSKGQDQSCTTEIVGVDISKIALKLARDNLYHNINLGYLEKSTEKDVSFRQFDVLDFAQNENGDSDKLASLGNDTNFDVLVSNPPYIHPEAYNAPRGISRSVRLFEPKLALISQNASAAPNSDRAQCNAGDYFYLPLLRIAKLVQAKAVVLEVSDAQQALRVQKLAKDLDMLSGTASGAFVAAAWDDNGQVVTDLEYRGSNENRMNRLIQVRVVVLVQEGWGSLE